MFDRDHPQAAQARAFAEGLAHGLQTARTDPTPVNRACTDELRAQLQTILVHDALVDLELWLHLAATFDQRGRTDGLSIALELAAGDTR